MHDTVIKFLLVERFFFSQLAWFYTFLDTINFQANIAIHS